MCTKDMSATVCSEYLCITGLVRIFLACAFFILPLTAAASELSCDVKENERIFSLSTEFGSFEFRVSTDFTRVTCLAVHVEQFQCGGITLTGDIQAQSRDIWPIVNNQFETDINLGIYRVIICGVFYNAYGTVCGTWKVHSTDTTCSGVWKYP